MTRQTTSAAFEDMDEETKECIENCEESNRACLRAVAYAVAEGSKEEAQHIRFFLDASDLSRLHVNLMLRESEWHTRIAEVCADACERCAEECDELEGEPFEACAEACRKAAETCRGMAEKGAAHGGEMEDKGEEGETETRRGRRTGSRRESGRVGARV